MMLNRNSLFVSFCLLFLFLLQFFSPLFPQDVDIGPAGTLGGTVRCGIVHNNHAYYGRGLSIRIADVSDPGQPHQMGKILLNGLPVDLAAQGQYLYVLFEGDSLAAYDISNPANPVRTGSCAAFGGGQDGKIVLAGGFAFISGYIYLHGIDLANPASPRNAGQTDIEADAAFAADGRLYAANQNDNQLLIYDILDPENPALLQTADTRDRIEDLVVRDGLAYLGSDTYPAGLQILDITDMDNIHEIGWAETEFGAEHVCLTGQTALLGNGWMYLIDVNDPANPVLQGDLDSEGSIQDIAAAGNYAFLFVGNAENGLQVVNISDLGNPAGSYSAPPEPFEVQHVRYGNDRLYVADNTSDLWIYTLDDPSNPALDKRFELDSSPDLMSVSVDGQKLRAVIWSTMFYQYDLSDPGAPIIETTYDAGQNISAYAVKNNTLFLLSQQWDGSNPVLEIIDIAGPGYPLQISETVLPGEGRALLVENNTAYIAHTPNGGGDGLLVLDVSDPTNPQNLGQAAISGIPMCMARIGETVYVGSNNQFGTIQWHIQGFDVSDPSLPAPLAEMAQASESGRFQQIWEMDVQGDLLFAGIRGGSAHVYNVDLNLLGLCPSYGTLGITVTPRNQEDVAWVYTPEGDGGTDNRYKQGHAGVAVQRVEVKPSTLKLIISGSKKREAMCPDSVLQNPIFMMPVYLEASQEDDWRVTQINLLADGTGQEDMDVREVKILWGSQEVFKGRYGLNSEKLSANLNPNVIVPAGKKIVLQLFYEFFFPVETYAKDTTFTFTVKTGTVLASPETRPGGDIEGMAKRDTLTIARIINSSDYGFAKIQKAVDSPKTPAGATVYVCKGTYEENVQIKKPLTLRSMHGKEYTTVFQKLSNVLELHADDIVIRDLTLKIDTKDQSDNISIFKKGYGNRCRILDNTITGGKTGVYLAGARDCIIRGNMIWKAGTGIDLLWEATANQIGGEAKSSQNVICNCGTGIRIRGKKTDANRIAGNIIGEDTTNVSTRGNSTGVLIKSETGLGSTGVEGPALNIIESNDIYNNDFHGVKISGKCYWNEIRANHIGCIRLPDIANDYGARGIVIEYGALENTIGGDKPEDGNYIWRNEKDGIVVEGQDTEKNRISRNSIIGNVNGIFLDAGAHDNIISYNTISANRKNGIHIRNAVSNEIKSNLIGVNRTKDGTSMYKFANQENGILITGGSKYNIIGFIENKDRNIVSGNEKNGVEISGSGTNQNQINNNLIGIDDTGKLALPNTMNGLYCHSGAQGNIIQSAVIAGNQENGILIDHAPKTAVDGCYIGVDDNRASVLPNKKAGIAVKDVSSCSVRNSSICGNQEEGIAVFGNKGFASHNEITNNYIGSNMNKEDLGNGGYGISIYPKSKYTTVNGNKIGFNQGGIEDLGYKSRITNNLFANNKGQTGIHITGGNPEISGNEIRNDETDAIYCQRGANPIIYKNNLLENGGFGINNVDASIQINAQDNWWGDPAGAAGGDGINGFVDASGWKEKPVSVVTAFSSDTVCIAPGKTDSVLCHFQNWENQTDLLELIVADPEGWISEELDHAVQLVENTGKVINVPITIPPEVTPGSSAYLKIAARSSLDNVQTDSDSLLICVYRPSLTQLMVVPDSVAIAPGDSVQFSVQGLDSVGNLFEVQSNWRATGGEIDSTGYYKAGEVEGIFYVIATETMSGIIDTGIVVITTDTHVEDAQTAKLPQEFALSQNYPNPFNPETTIQFAVKERCEVILKLYDILGREVRTVIQEQMAPGVYRRRFNARGLSTGVYLYRIQMRDFVAVRKMVIMD